MSLINAKCSNCGANLKVDGINKIVKCSHCGASFLTEDVVINNITNINLAENINGIKLNRSAVLENMLIEYYKGKFQDVDNIKEYALKVQEQDINNVLARFVVFEEIDSLYSITKLLSDVNLNISLQLFIMLLNKCNDIIIDDEIIKNLAKYSSVMDVELIIKNINENYSKKDFNLILKLVYYCGLPENKNNKILENLYNNKKTNKIVMLSQLQLFTDSNPNFLYDKQRFNSFADHWKRLKEKHLAARPQYIENTKNESKNNMSPQKVNNKKRWMLCCLGVSVFVILLIIVLCLCLP